MEDSRCRICLQNNKIRLKLDDTLEERHIWELINTIADVKVAVGDSFPQWICLECSRLLSQSFKFKQEVEKSDKIFHNNEFEYVTVLKTENEEEFAAVEASEDLTNILEPTVIIKSKRGRAIKKRTYQEEDVEDRNSLENAQNEVKIEESEESDTVEDVPKTRKRKSKVTEFRCCMCQSKFSDENLLTSHVEAQHIEEIQSNLSKKFITRQIYECPYCHLKFRSRKYLNMHFDDPHYKEPPRKRIYKPKRQKSTQNIVCTYCGKISADIYESRIHELRVHAEDCPIECEFPGCNKRFAAKIIMKKHLRIHAEKKFVCDICGKAFQREKYLLKHEFVHRDEKPLSCEFCTKGFIHQNALKAHLEFHLTEKVWNCDQCEKTYKWKEDLQKHVRGVHLGDHPYKCKFCNKGYFCSSSRKYHQDRCQQSSTNDQQQMVDMKDV
ncbi:zinc finger protein 845-like [Culicoides brevitarsis]|uniref:zinc finger protein 845-like n=1 Tax=Culicoides brevitarsis TaxID=469753 RepID=UPI00307BC1BC